MELIISAFIAITRIMVVTNFECYKELMGQSVVLPEVTNMKKWVKSLASALNILIE